MRASTRRVLPLLVLLPLAVACAPKRPVLYPNETVNNVGWDAANRDIDECLKFAEAYGFDDDAAGRTATGTAAGGALGGATGAVWGAVRGGAGSRAAAGAAAGATGGFLRGLFRWRDPDPTQARFVQVCLRRQGYEVIGWK
jgi:outer membrane lipoprotein SlyB